MSNAATNTKKEYTPLPEGDYVMRLESATIVVPKSGAGRMVKAMFEVSKGDEKGAKVFENFLIEHTSPKAVEIANERLNKFLQSVGVDEGLDGIGHDYTQLTEYEGEPFIASLKIKEGTNGYSDQNRIAAFKKR